MANEPWAVFVCYPCSWIGNRPRGLLTTEKKCPECDAPVDSQIIRVPPPVLPEHG